jgi:hypothetical protein
VFRQHHESLQQGGLRRFLRLQILCYDYNFIAQNSHDELLPNGLCRHRAQRRCAFTAVKRPLSHPDIRREYPNLLMLAVKAIHLS